MAFWVVAARNYDVDAVGRSAAMLLVVAAAGGLAHSGLLVGVLGGPTRRSRTASWSALGITMALAAAGVGIFIGGLDLWASGLTLFRDSAPVLFLVASGAAALAGFIALSDQLEPRSGLAPGLGFGHIGLGVSRVVLLLVLPDRAQRYGIVVAWIIPLLVVAILALVRTASRPVSDDGRVPTRNATPPDRIGRVVGHSGLALVALIMLSRSGPAEVAYLLVAWLPAHAVYRLLLSFTDAAIAEPTPEGQLSDRFRLLRVVETMVLALPLVVVAAVMAPQISAIFGSSYGQSSSTLRLFALAAVPAVSVRLVGGRPASSVFGATVVGIQLVAGAAVVVLSWLLIGWLDLFGAGVAVAVVAVVVGGAVLAEQSVWWWGQRLTDRSATFMARAITWRDRIRRRLRRRPLDRQVNQTLANLYHSRPAWRRLWSAADRQAVAVSGHEGRPPFQIEFARSKGGVSILGRRVAAVAAVTEIESAPDLRRLVPYPIEHVEQGATGYLIESAVSGELGTEPVAEDIAKQRVQAVLDAVGELHRATAEHLPLDGETLDHWVTRPLRYLGDACRLPDSELVSIGRTLFEGLEGAQVRFAQVHGSLRLDNTLFEPGGVRLTGLLGWEWSERGPVLADRGVLTLSAMALQQRRDVGIIVRQLVDNPSPFAEHPAFVIDLGDDLAPRALVLLAWLHYLKPTLSAAADVGVGDYWTARNVQPVLSRLRASL